MNPSTRSARSVTASAPYRAPVRLRARSTTICSDWSGVCRSGSSGRRSASAASARRSGSCSIRASTGVAGGCFSGIRRAYARPAGGVESVATPQGFAQPVASVRRGGRTPARARRLSSPRRGCCLRLSRPISGWSRPSEGQTPQVAAARHARGVCRSVGRPFAVIRVLPGTLANRVMSDNSMRSRGWSLRQADFHYQRSENLRLFIRDSSYRSEI